MNFDESGTLVVRAFTAGGALPLEGTRIKITGALEENRFYETNLITDVDGLTAKVVLPAPNRSYSLAPGAPELGGRSARSRKALEIVGNRLRVARASRNLRDALEKLEEKAVFFITLNIKHIIASISQKYIYILP